MNMDYPGYLLAHRGYEVQISELAAENLSLWEEKLRLILSQLEEERTLAACIAAVAKELHLGGKSRFVRMAVGRSVRAMVQYLVDCGLVCRQTRDWVDYYRRV